MTVQMLQNMFNTKTENKLELLQLADALRKKGTIELSQFASLKASINSLNKVEKKVKKDTPYRYDTKEIILVQKSHLEVYDGIKDVEAHLNFMKQVFGELSSQFRNGDLYNKFFHQTLNTGRANIGHSMPANWADVTLNLIQDRSMQFNNTLLACKEICQETNNQNMCKVVKKWSKHY